MSEAAAAMVACLCCCRGDSAPVPLAAAARSLCEACELKHSSAGTQ